MNVRILLALAALPALAAPLAAQNRLRADLDGAQEIPPNSSPARGWGTAVLNSDLTVTYHVETAGIVGTTAHFHLGAPGTMGAILFALSGGPTTWSGTTPPWSVADAAALRAGGVYFNVHSITHPFGEIRGQILPAPSAFAGRAEGAQMTPPNASAAVATGVFTVLSDRSVEYVVHATGIVSTATEIHVGAPGLPGPRIFNFGTGVGPWIGRTTPLTEEQYEQFQAGLTYLNLHSLAFPLGEIRGQIYASGESFGASCASPQAPACRLSSENVPYSGATVTLQVTGGAAGGRGVLAVSLAPGALPGLCPRWIADPLLASAAVRLDAAGAALRPILLPSVPADRTLYLQFVGLAAGAVDYASNALALTVEVF